MNQATQDIVLMVCAIIAGLVGLISLWKFLAPKLKKVYLAMFSNTQFNELTSKVDFLVTELSPNSGSTIKDALCRIEFNQRLLYQRTKALWADHPEGLMESDARGNIFYVNRTICHTVDRIPSELMGSGWLNCVIPEDKEKVAKEWYKSIQENRELELDFSIKRKDSSPIKVSLKSYVLESDSHKPIGFMVMIK